MISLSGVVGVGGEHSGLACRGWEARLPSKAKPTPGIVISIRIIDADLVSLEVMIYGNPICLIPMMG
jgi:hypothetical protein